MSLIKKQRLINDALEREFKEIVEFNEETINYNLILTRSNQTKESDLKKTKGKIAAMESVIRDHEKHFNKNIRKSTSQQKLAYEYLDLIEEQPFHSFLQLLKEEVDVIDVEAVKKKKLLVKSYSAAKGVKLL